LPVSSIKKVSAIFYFRIFGIVLRFNSGVHVFGDIISAVSVA